MTGLVNAFGGKLLGAAPLRRCKALALRYGNAKVVCTLRRADRVNAISRRQDDAAMVLSFGSGDS
jgi:hypothetical protein